MGFTLLHEYVARRYLQWSTIVQTVPGTEGIAKYDLVQHRTVHSSSMVLSAAMNGAVAGTAFYSVDSDTILLFHCLSP